MLVNEGMGGSLHGGPLLSGIPLAKIASFSLPRTGRAMSLMLEVCDAFCTSCDTRLITGGLLIVGCVLTDNVDVVVVVAEGVVPRFVATVVVVLVDGEVVVFVVGVVPVAVEGDVTVVATDAGASLVDDGCTVGSVFAEVDSKLLLSSTGVTTSSSTSFSSSWMKVRPVRQKAELMGELSESPSIPPPSLPLLSRVVGVGGGVGSEPDAEEKACVEERVATP